MTPETLETYAQIFEMTRYHIANGRKWSLPPGEPCLAAARALRCHYDLLAACKALLKFNEELCVDVGVSKHYPSAEKARNAITRAEA